MPDLLAELSASGVQQWIVTSSGKASVEALLRSLSTDMRDAFQGMVTADDVERHKPNPIPICVLWNGVRFLPTVHWPLKIQHLAFSRLAVHVFVVC